MQNRSARPKRPGSFRRSSSDFHNKKFIQSYDARALGAEGASCGLASLVANPHDQSSPTERARAHRPAGPEAAGRASGFAAEAAAERAAPAGPAAGVRGRVRLLVRAPEHRPARRVPGCGSDHRALGGGPGPGLHPRRSERGHSVGPHCRPARRRARQMGDRSDTRGDHRHRGPVRDAAPVGGGRGGQSAHPGQASGGGGALRQPQHGRHGWPCSPGSLRASRARSSP